MKKLLFTLLIIIFMIPNVNAEADISCSTSVNMLKPGNFISGVYKPFDYSPSNLSYAEKSYNGLIPIEPSTTYHYQNDFNSSGVFRVGIAYYDKDFNYLSYTNEKTTSTKYSYTFITLENAYYITLHLYNTSLATLNSSKYQLEKGDSLTEFVDYVECPVVEPEPEPIPVDIPSKIYLPSIDYACLSVQGDGVVRAYKEMPTNDITVNYRDYYINSEYLYKDGTQTFNNYSNLPTCLDSSIFTTDTYYKKDINKLYIMLFVIASILTISFIYKFLNTFFNSRR